MIWTSRSSGVWTGMEAMEKEFDLIDRDISGSEARA